MKKTLKRMLCLMMVLVMCLSIQIPTSAATAKWTAAQKTYEKYMSLKRGSYSIRDLDGNGMPELIFTLTDTNASYVYTYNYSTRKMVRIIAMNLGTGSNRSHRAAFSASKHMVCLYNSSYGYEQYRFYQISGTRATLKYKYETKMTKRFGYGADGYFLNGRKYTKAAVERSLNNLLRSFKYTEYYYQL